MLKQTLTAILICVIIAVLAYADGEGDSYKADFVVKLFSYVDWPAGKGVAADGSAIIGVVGSSSCLRQIQSAAAQRTAEGKKTVVKELTIDGDFTGCQIIFFQTQEKADLAKILKKSSAQPILTVGDCPGFAKFGVMVNFYTESEGAKDKVKFEVNTVTLGDAQLKMSSSLLKLARVI